MPIAFPVLVGSSSASTLSLRQPPTAPCQGPHRTLPYVQDDDRAAYIIYSSHGNKDLHIGRLTKDYTDVSATFKKAGGLVGKKREAPALFKHRGCYFMITSGCTGWDPNKALVHMTK